MPRHASRNPAFALLLALAALWLVACAAGEEAVPGEDGLSGRLVLTGSSTVAPLVAEIGRRFEGLHPGVRIQVQTGGSSRGIRDIREGVADIGMASRALAERETRGLRAHTIARDAIGLVVHADNPVAVLSADQVRGIYLGKIGRWSQVGGRDSRITVIDKAAGRATRDVFVGHFELDEAAIRADVVIGDNEQGIKSVSVDPDAIAYVSVGAASYHTDAGVSIRSLAVEDAGAYGIMRPLNLITRTEIAGLARAFIDYSQSRAVHDLVRDLYLVPLSDAGRG